MVPAFKKLTHLERKKRFTQWLQTIINAIINPFKDPVFAQRKEWLTAVKVLRMARFNWGGNAGAGP